MIQVRMSNETARRYFLHANDTNDDGSLSCYFSEKFLNEDGWGFWVDLDGSVVVDKTSANGELPSHRIVDACVRSAVKFLATT